MRVETPSFVFDASVSSVVPASDGPAAGSVQSAAARSAPLGAELLKRMQRYWQAANYLTVGQIFLQDNALLREPLRPEHIKPRLLGHWGTSPGQSLIYIHLNLGCDSWMHGPSKVMYLAGPGHGGRKAVGSPISILRGNATRTIYPRSLTRDAAGIRHLFRQFSTPGGIPSHVSVTTPGSIHEGGELGYVLAHAFGAAFDNWF